MTNGQNVKGQSDKRTKWQTDKMSNGEMNRTERVELSDKWT